MVALSLNKFVFWTNISCLIPCTDSFCSHGSLSCEVCDWFWHKLIVCEQTKRMCHVFCKWMRDVVCDVVWTKGGMFIRNDLTKNIDWILVLSIGCWLDESTCECNLAGVYGDQMIEQVFYPKWLINMDNRSNQNQQKSKNMQVLY